MQNESYRTVTGLVELHADRIEQEKIEQADPQSPASAAYYSLAERDNPLAYYGYENSPLEVLDVLGTDVPNEWTDYWGDGVITQEDCSAQSALQAMARRALEEAIAIEVEQRNERN